MRGDSIRSKKDARRLVEGGKEKAGCSREAHKSRRTRVVVIMKRRGGPRAFTQGERHDEVDDRKRKSTQKGGRKRGRGRETKSGETQIEQHVKRASLKDKRTKNEINTKKYRR